MSANKTFWVLFGIIVVASVADYLIPQLPALSISEAVFEITTLVSLGIIGALKIMGKLKFRKR